MEDPSNVGPPGPEKTNPPELGGVGGGSEVAPDLGDLVGGYRTRKLAGIKVARYLAGTYLDHISHRLFRCGRRLHFRHWLDLDRYTLKDAKFCQLHLLCATCAHRRAARHGAKVHAKLAELAATGLYDAWFLTLTVKNGPDLSERVAHARDSFRRYVQRAKDARRGRGGPCELARVVGMVASYEVTRNADTGEWHPHVHILALVPAGSGPIYWGHHPEWGESQLRRDWREVTGDSCITHARRVDLADPWKAIAETVKYPLKLAGLEPCHSVEAWKVLASRRLTEAFGVLRGTAVTDDDPLTDADLVGRYMDIFAKWNTDTYRVEFGGVDEVLEGVQTRTLSDSQGIEHANSQTA